MSRLSLLAVPMSRDLGAAVQVTVTEAVSDVHLDYCQTFEDYTEILETVHIG